MTVRRGYLKPIDVAPPPAPGRLRCRSCGVCMPVGQVLRPPAKYYRCSYCVGDPYWGKDGYLLDIIAEELERVKKEHGKLVASQHALALALEMTRSADRRRICRRYFGIAGT